MLGIKCLTCFKVAIVGNKKFSPKQSLLRKFEMLTTLGLFVALLITGRAVAKAATVAVAPSSEPSIAGTTDMSNAITQRLKRMGDNVNSKLTVLQFSAKWCEPCQQMEEAMATAKEQFGDQVEFVKVDIDDPKNAELQAKYDVGPIPALFYLNKEGVVVHETVGYGGKDWFLGQLTEFTGHLVASK